MHKIIRFHSTFNQFLIIKRFFQNFYIITITFIQNTCSSECTYEKANAYTAKTFPTTKRAHQPPKNYNHIHTREYYGHTLYGKRAVGNESWWEAAHISDYLANWGGEGALGHRTRIAPTTGGWKRGGKGVDSGWLGGWASGGQGHWHRAGEILGKRWSLMVLACGSSVGTILLRKGRSWKYNKYAQEFLYGFPCANMCVYELARNHFLINAAEFSHFFLFGLCARRLWCGLCFEGVIFWF